MHASESSNIKLYFLFLRVQLVNVDFYIFNFFLVLFELSVSLVLGVEMRKNFVINSQFEGLSLLDDVECKSVESERVLEGHVRWKFVFE